MPPPVYRRESADYASAYRAIFEHARAAILVAGDDCRYLDVNPAACALLGYTRDELLRLSIWDVTVQEEIEDGRRLWQQFLAAGHLSGEYRMRRKDGTTVAVEFTSVANVAPGMHLSINRDLTDRRQAEAELRSSQAKLLNIMSLAPIIAFALDRHGVVRLSVGKGLDAIGLQPNEIAGRSVFELYQDVPDGIAQVRRALAGETLVGVVQLNGRCLQVWYSPHTAPDGVIDGVVGIATDITERRQLEEQLRQAQKLESVGLLAGGIAHDFNNMLTAITGYAELILDDLPPDSPLRGDVTQITDVAARGALLTYQLLAFSRKQILRPTTLHLGEVVADLTRMLERVIGENITIVATGAPDLGLVSADPGQVSQVILNLAVNARDAMPDGGTLTIETSNVQLRAGDRRTNEPVAPGPYVMLTVRDTGHGMTPEVRERVFEPFFTTKPMGKGTGMGLATVYGIVKQSGGYVRAESEQGRGATFRIFLPRVEREIVPQEQRTDGGALARGDETILLVEDEHVLRQLMKRTLESCGYTVCDAADGEAALSCLESGLAPHLLVTDVIMPQMGGAALVDRLKRRWPALRVLYMSGYTDSAVVREGLLEPGLEFIQKPFGMRALTQKVREMLDKSFA